MGILKSLINDLTVSTQRLFIRLYLRKAGWQRLNRLVYEDIPNVNEASHELKEQKSLLNGISWFGWLFGTFDFELNWNQFASSEIILKLSNSSIQRDELIKLILESNLQDNKGSFRFHFKSTSNPNSKLDILKQSTGPIIKINDQLRLLIDTAVSLYFLVSSSNQENQLVNCNSSWNQSSFLPKVQNYSNLSNFQNETGIFGISKGTWIRNSAERMRRGRKINLWLHCGW